ncbi:hypothetical protein NMS_2586 [Nonlabens marinus S1-08]|uniref:Outer membrane protein beta-barrel domain-containing protein n=2 Tax=Nonlabens TaxID=363408 RepID=W8VSX6_9FLAO|nr:hypothetical protein NMS_2586 [Nonlabens marinus S1-08]
MMKQILLIGAVIFSSIAAKAQTSNNGIKAGFNSLSLSVSDENVSANSDLSGFYIGVYGEFGLSENFNIQPELQAILSFSEGESSSTLALPVMFEYLATPKLALQAGPQFEFLLDENSEGLRKFGVGFGTGLSFDLTDKLFIDGRYVFGLNNRFEDDLGFGDDIKLNFNYIQVGLGFRL